MGTSTETPAPVVRNGGLCALARDRFRALFSRHDAGRRRKSADVSRRIVGMSLVINFNSAAVNAHRNLQNTDRMLQTSIQHLSSGLRVNTAADDPAGLVIAQSLQAQSDGLGQAISNANDGVNLVKTAEGALNEVH